LELFEVMNFCHECLNHLYCCSCVGDQCQAGAPSGLESGPGT
jgi:hypothetical protein